MRPLPVGIHRRRCRRHACRATRSRRNAIRVPSGEKLGRRVVLGPPTTSRLCAGDRVADVDVAARLVRDRPVAGRPERSRHAPLARTGVERGAATTRAMTTSASAISRHGGAGANARERVMSAIGSHLSGNVQPGRCRMRPVRAKTSSRYSGVGPAARSSRIVGQGALEARRGGHATCPPVIGVGDGGSVSTATRISPRARWSRDLTVPIGMPSVAATSVSGIPRK